MEERNSSPAALLSAELQWASALSLLKSILEPPQKEEERFGKNKEMWGDLPIICKWTHHTHLWRHNTQWSDERMMSANMGSFRLTRQTKTAGISEGLRAAVYNWIHISSSRWCSCRPSFSSQTSDDFFPDGNRWKVCVCCCLLKMFAPFLHVWQYFCRNTAASRPSLVPWFPAWQESQSKKLKMFGIF